MNETEGNENKEIIPLPYESNTEYCRECRSTKVYTRVYFHEKTLHSIYLCRNCAEEDYGPRRGYRLLSVDCTIPKKG